MMFKSKKFLATILSAGFVFAFASGVVGVVPSEARSLQDRVLFSENFDSLTNDEFNKKFVNIGDAAAGKVQLVDGGVSDSGKMLKIEKWSLVQTDVDFKKAEGITVSAWVLAANSEQRIFSVQNGMNYYLKGGNISNDDHSVVAWGNFDGKALINNDPTYSGIFNDADDTFYRLTVTVSKECIKFYKNNLIIDAYYTCNDRPSGDIKKFIDNFFIGMETGKLGLGGGVLDEQYLGDYFIDSICVYDFAAETYNDLCAIAAHENKNLSEKYRDIVSDWIVKPAVNEKPPIIFYDFSNVNQNVVVNAGSLQKFDASILGEFEIVDEKLVLNGNGYMALPQSLFPVGTKDFSVSMDIKRDTASNADMFYSFSPESYENGPSGLNFVDCWMKTRSDDAVPVDVSWIITDYCDTNYTAPHWNLAMTTPDLNEFNLTTVYKNSNLYVYVNGFLFSKTQVTGGISPENFVYGYIGRGYWDRNNYRGTIDNIAIYDYALEEESIISVANRVNIVVDMPSDATEEDDISKYLYCNFARSDEKGYSIDIDSIKALKIDYNTKTPQTFKIKEGVAVDVFFRDIMDLQKNVTYGVGESLPKNADISYSDGTKQLLPVIWDNDYSFGGASSYAGKAVDKAGREANVIFNVTYRADKDELEKLIVSVEEVLAFRPLYTASEFAAFNNAVIEAFREAKTIYENTDASATEILEATVRLKTALDGVEKPVRSVDYKVYSVSVSYSGVPVKVSVLATNKDIVSVSSKGIEVKLYSTTGTADTLQGLFALSNGEYTIKIVRRITKSLPTAILDVYLMRGDVVLTVINSAVSENIGLCTIEKSVVTDISLISYYTSISGTKYSKKSLSEYDKYLADNEVPKSVDGWLNLTAEQLRAISEKAEIAYEKLEYTKISQVNAFMDITCKPGTNIEDLIPKTTKVTYDNGTTNSLRIAWDKSNLDLTKAGEYILTGYISEYDGSNYTVRLKIIVKDDEKPDSGRGSLVGLVSIAAVFLVMAVATVTVIIVKNKKANKNID